MLLAENLSPGELKKMKNKLRKKAKQEAQRREKQRLEEQKKEASRAKSQDAELDGPKEEELVPEKLSKVWLLHDIISGTRRRQLLLKFNSSYLLLDPRRRIIMYIAAQYSYIWH